MKLRDVLPYRAAAAVFCLLTALAEAQSSGLTQLYCSSQNTGADGVFNTWQSNGACKTQCQGSYSFAIVQRNYCWCSNYIPSGTVDVAECSETCPGYPTDLCGNLDSGLFGYIFLDRIPAGTAAAVGGGGASSSSSTTVAAATSKTSASTQSQTDVVSLVQTVTATQEATVVVSYITLPPSTTSTSSESTSTSTSSTDSDESNTTFEPSTTISAPSVLVVTQSGKVVTQTITATPIIASGQDVASVQVQQQKDAISGGAIAGIVIGVLAGVAILALAGFLLWRRRRRQHENTGGATAVAAGAISEKKPPPKRNTSVLSRSGLLFHKNDNAGNSFDEPANGGTASQRHSALFGLSAAEAVNPESPLGTGYSGDGRRHSKPMLYDQRLNPSALFGNLDNGSRVSMQDGADYSRPLGVTNPDPRSSWESRFSRR